MADGMLQEQVANMMAEFEAQVANQLRAMPAGIENELVHKELADMAAQMEELRCHALAQQLDQKEAMEDLRNKLRESSKQNQHRQLEEITPKLNQQQDSIWQIQEQLALTEQRRSTLEEQLAVQESSRGGDGAMQTEISEICLEMGVIQGALKTHGAWTESIHQDLQQMCERCHQLPGDIAKLRDATQLALDAK
eukprot:12894494-Prorocentrum_lima.AAC.1